MQPFNQFRFKHQHFIFQPRTIEGVQQADSTELDFDFIESGWDYLTDDGARTTCCAEAMRCWNLGA